MSVSGGEYVMEMYGFTNTLSFFRESYSSSLSGWDLEFENQILKRRRFRMGSQQTHNIKINLKSTQSIKLFKLLPLLILLAHSTE
jgi:hypothetical protein